MIGLEISRLMIANFDEILLNCSDKKGTKMGQVLLWAGND
jgi:hypothetical protein